MMVQLRNYLINVRINTEISQESHYLRFLSGDRALGWMSPTVWSVAVGGAKGREGWSSWLIE